MVEILHVDLKKIHQLVSYVFLAENKNLVFFQHFKGEKYLERGPAIWLLTPNGIFGYFLINIFEINVKFGF
jgi:hypothetical protein